MLILVLVLLTAVMVWVICGMLTVYFMVITDKQNSTKDERYLYLIARRKDIVSLIVINLLLGPIGLVSIGAIALIRYTKQIG